MHRRSLGDSTRLILGLRVPGAWIPSVPVCAYHWVRPAARTTAPVPDTPTVHRLAQGAPCHRPSCAPYFGEGGRPLRQNHSLF